MKHNNISSHAFYKAEAALKNYLKERERNRKHNETRSSQKKGKENIHRDNASLYD